MLLISVLIGRTFPFHLEFYIQLQNVSFWRGKILQCTCIDQGISSANDLRMLAMKYHKAGTLSEETTLPSLNLLNGAFPHQALLQPQISSIDDYQYILTHSNALKT